MGAIFRINIVETSDLVKTVEQIKKHKYKIMATAVEAEKTIYQVDYQKKAIIIGNEANGVSKEIIKRADETIKIPMLGKTESLNASVATGIILYEYTRQKQSC